MSYKVSVNGDNWKNIETIKFYKTNEEIPVNEENLKTFMIELIENQLWYSTRFIPENGICEMAFVKRFDD